MDMDAVTAWTDERTRWIAFMGENMKFDWKQFVMLVGPLVMAATGKERFIPLVPVIVQGIVSAEELLGDDDQPLTGPEKKAHVLGVTEAAVAAANATGQVELDPVEVADAADHAIDTVVKVANIVRDAKVSP
jgi:hypothetical protein